MNGNIIINIKLCGRNNKLISNIQNKVTAGKQIVLSPFKRLKITNPITVKIVQVYEAHASTTPLKQKLLLLISAKFGMSIYY